VQDVEPAVFFRGELRHLFADVGVGDVAGEHARLKALVLDLLRQLLGPLGAAVDQHHPGALAREQNGARHAVADALAARCCARHHRHFSLEPIGHNYAPEIWRHARAGGHPVLRSFGD
jgi:hypothetical protein